MNILTFQSDRFRPYLPDDLQVNPNVLGFELADWLSRQLASRGIVTSYPGPEDWGWFLAESGERGDCMICCGGSAVDDGSFEWKVFVTRPKKLFRRPVDSGRARELEAAIQKILEEAGIRVTIE